MPPLKVEYAKSARSRCSLKECAQFIDKGDIRIGTGTMMPGSTELSYKWRHLNCFTKRQLASVTSAAALEGVEDLLTADQEMMKKMVRGELVGRADLVGARKRAREAEVGVAAAASSVSARPSRTAAADPDREGERCPFGAMCFRTNPKHFRDMLH